jgi:hypothetical protein
MPQQTFGDYTIIFSPGELCSIDLKDAPNMKILTKCAVDFNDDDDVLVISQYNPTTVAATTKYFRLLVGYTDDPNNNDPENSGRYELYFRSSEEEAFVHLVVFRIGFPRSIAQNMMAFLQNPDAFHENPPNNITNNNNTNNNNNNNNASTVSGSNASNVGSVGGRRRRKNRKTRKGRK